MICNHKQTETLPALDVEVEQTMPPATSKPDDAPRPSVTQPIAPSPDSTDVIGREPSEEGNRSGGCSTAINGACALALLLLLAVAPMLRKKD